MTYERKKGYWDPRPILGYNAKWNIVASDRGRGKTYNTIPMMLNNPGGSQFMSLTRNTEDLVYAVKNDWMGWAERIGYDPDLVDWEISRSFANLYYDNQEWGYFRALTMVDHVKHEEFPKTCNWVMFDEFIPLAWKKLPGVENEGEALETIVDTIDHDSVNRRTAEGYKPLRVMMYCNPFTWANPILRYFNVKPCGYGIHRIRNNRIAGGIVFEHLEPLDTQVGVRRQEGWMKETAFIEPISKGAVPIWSARFGDEFYIAYRAETKIWIAKRDDHMNITAPGNVRYGSFEGLQIDEQPITKTRIKMLMEWTRGGQLLFEDINAKFGWIAALENYK